MLSIGRGYRGISRICLAAAQAAASKKFVVPVGVDDVEGTAAAIKKAVELARDGDMISCVHVPRPFPEYLLSSMNDPGAVSAEGEALFFGGYLKSLFEATGPSIITKVRKEVEDLAVEKNLQTEYKLLSPSNNVKVELVAHCRTAGADYVVVGPGKDCSGRMAEWLCGNVRGATVVAVRDHCRGTVQLDNVEGPTPVINGDDRKSNNGDVRRRKAVSLDVPRRTASRRREQRAYSLITQITADEPGVRTAKVIRQIPIEARYKLYPNKILGTGMNGAVVLARHRGTGRMCAVKTFSTAELDAARYERLYNEVDIFLRMDHPNVCKLLEVYEDQTHVYLVMEACMGKDLYERLAIQKRYTEMEAAVAAEQMLEAVHYCHAHGVCHRDLKLENWVYADTRQDAPLRLIDFGISQAVSTPREKMSDTHGTVYYVAPEILKGAYDVRCDVWSIGVIVYMLLSGSPPFTGSDPRQTVRKICEADLSFDGPRWNGVSDLAKSFVADLLQKNPTDRPTALQASKHPWIAQFVPVHDPQSALISPDLLEVLCQFAKESDVKRAALSLVAFSINPKDVCDSLADEFRSLDFDESGTIRLGDLTKALTERLGLNAEEAEKIFRKLDQTGDEEIHYSEFLAACLQHRITLTEQDVKDAFCRFDVDNSGVISLSNLRDVLGDRFCGTSVEDLLKEADVNNEGYITYEAFRQTLMDPKETTSFTFASTVSSLHAC